MRDPPRDPVWVVGKWLVSAAPSPSCFVIFCVWLLTACLSELVFLSTTPEQPWREVIENRERLTSTHSIRSELLHENTDFSARNEGKFGCAIDIGSFGSNRSLQSLTFAICCLQGRHGLNRMEYSIRYLVLAAVERTQGQVNLTFL